MAIGKIYDSEELKRIDVFMSSKDQEMKDSDKKKDTVNKNVYIGLIAISVVVVGIFAVNYIIKK